MCTRAAGGSTEQLLLYQKEKKSKIRSKTMLKLDSIKAEIPAIRPVLAEVGDSL